MVDTKEILRARLRNRLDATGKSAHSVSKEIGTNAGYVRDLLDPEKTSIPSAARLIALATALGTTGDWLLGLADDQTPLNSEAVFRDAPKDWRSDEREGIPVLATGYCDDLQIADDGNAIQVERVQLELDQVVRYVHRPAYLRSAQDAYAIDLLGDSMEPVLPQGSVRLVDPRRAPAPGDDVVVQLTDGNGGNDIVTVLVKRFVRATSAYVELRQFNPDVTFRVPRTQVVRLHRIVSYDELLR